uniref:PB1-like domain-containing protein n=1 Tax=Chenopodium quinoa TaxID=63459 RepID=A0A803LLK9_CHEQI
FAMSSFFDSVTIRFWHGGEFKHQHNGELVYVGGKGRNFKADTNLLCYWELLEYANKCGYIAVAGIYYLVPGMSLEDGLRKIDGDEEVLELIKIANTHKRADVYFLHHKEPSERRHAVQSEEGAVSNPAVQIPPLKPNLKEKQASSPSKPPSVVPDLDKETENPFPNLYQFPSCEFVSIAELPSVNTTFLDYDWVDNRGDSPLRWSELIGDDDVFSDDSDPTYEPDPEYKKFCEGGEFKEDEIDDEYEVDGDRDTEQDDDFSLDDIDLEVKEVAELEALQLQKEVCQTSGATTT